MQIGPSRPRSKDMKRSTLGHGIKGQGHMRPQGHTVSIIVSRCQKNSGAYFAVYFKTWRMHYFRPRWV